jgi:integrase
MPLRSDSPGLKWRKTAKGRQAYWVAKQVVRDPMGFPDKTVRLTSGASDDELAELCREHTADLLRWIDDAKNGREPDVRYDGTVKSLSQLFQTHAESPFHGVKPNTRESYVDSLKVIESTVGARVVYRLTVVDVRRWYRNWRAPKVEGGPERIKRAHDAVATFRMILRFGFALGHDECGKLDDRLAKQRFEKSGAREQEMTYPQAAAFVRKALELGQQGIIPQDRARHMAIGVAAQFELALRQKDIIGEWSKKDEWSGVFTWQNVPGWKLRLKTSKNRAAAVFTLSNYPLLFPLLEAVPHEERVGAIVKGEHNLPVRERSYRKWFRAIARTAEIPDEVWSMDSRAGAATEADEAGADLAAISDMLTHANPGTTLRYVRRREKRIAVAAEARARSRTT